MGGSRTREQIAQGLIEDPFGAPRRRFLTAEWRYLAMLNFEVPPALLEPRVPHGTELDLCDGRAFISLVGFRFLNTRVYGVPVPFHRSFDEVNLRFYVRRGRAGALKRGVVFIQEIVPRRAIAAIARWTYRENYRALPMSHRVLHADAAPEVEYAWRLGRITNRLTVLAQGAPRETTPGSLQQFIAEHYWGYCAQPGGTVEYHVSHPPWRVWDVSSAAFSGEGEALYGPEFGAILRRPPHSALLAEGSPVAVYKGIKLPAV